MSNIFKRFLACLLSLMMLVSLIPFGAISVSAAEVEEEEINSVSESNDEITVVDSDTWGGIDWTLTSDGTLTIAPTDNEITDVRQWDHSQLYERGEWPLGADYYVDNYWTPYDMSKVKYLVIEEGVTFIGSYALQGASNLTGDVVLPSTLTYIGAGAFNGCSIKSLTFAKVPEGQEAKELCIGVQSFKKNDFTEVILPADRPSVHVHTWTFEDCDQLKSVVFPANVTFIGYTHLEYMGMDDWWHPQFGGDSQILARAWALENLIFGSEDVQKAFYRGANNTSNINAIKEKAAAKGRTFNEMTAVALIGTTGYETLQAAINAATAGQTIDLIADVNENVTINKAITIDGNNRTYTGQMVLTVSSTVKNVNFDGKGAGVYAIVTQGASDVTIEDCTVKNYKPYGFLNINSNNNSTTVRNVTGSDIGYGIKIDSCNSLTLENVKFSASTAAVLNCNNGQKPINIKDCELSILGTWKKKDAVKTFYTFEGSNKIDTFIIEADLDVFKLAAGATLTAPNVITATTNVEGYEVAYNDGVYSVVEKKAYVAMIGEHGFATLAEAIAACTNGDYTITLLQDCAETVTIKQTEGVNITIDGNGKTYSGTIKVDGNKRPSGTETLTIKNVNFSFQASGYKDFIDARSSASGGNSQAHNVTVDNCTFTSNNWHYAIAANHPINWTVKNCTANNVYYFFYIPQGGDTITVENCNVPKATYGIGAQKALNVYVKDYTYTGKAAGFYGRFSPNASVATLENVNITTTLPGQAPIAIWKVDTVAPFAVYTIQLKGENVANGIVMTKTNEAEWLGLQENRAYEIIDLNRYPSGHVAYRADVTDKADREGIAILLKEVYAKESVVVKVYNNNTLMFTCTRRDIDDEGKVMFPVDGNTTANIVLWGKESGSWINEILVAPTELNVPNKIEVYADGVLVDSYTHESGTVLGVNLDKYLALDCVKKAVAQVGETKYMTFKEAYNAAQAGDTIVLLQTADVNFNIDKAITIDGSALDVAINITKGCEFRNVTVKGTIDCRGYKSLYVYSGTYDKFTFDFYQNFEVYGGTFNGYNPKEHLYKKGTCAVKNGDVYTVYNTLAEAFAAAEDGATIYLGLYGATLDTMIVNTKKVTLDLNGKTITGTDNTDKNFSLIDNRGELIITGNGKMTLKATVNSGWSRYSAVIANNPGGKLVVESGTIEHLGGTDMAYGIDNLTNGKGTYAETIINGGTIKSTYRGIRQFLNGVEAQNILTINGGTVEGANKAIFFHDPSTKANTGKLTVAEGATLNGDIYLFVTAGSTEWPVEVSIAASAVNGEVITGNVPAKYALEKANGVYTIAKAVASVNGIGYTSFAEAVAAAKAGDTIVVLTTIKVTEDTTLNLNGITVKASESCTYDIFDVRNGATLTINGGNFDSTASPQGYTIYIGNNSATRSGNVVINGGTFVSRCTVAYVGCGSLTINGGNFSIVELDNFDYKYVINCQDDNYKSGKATVTIKGGTFEGFNPQNNAAEGVNTKFTAEGYAVDIIDGKYKVVNGVVALINYSGNTIGYFKTLEAAVNKASKYYKIKLLCDTEGNGIVIAKSISINFNGFTYTFSGNAVGSTGTETNGFQVLEGYIFNLSNGTLKVADSAAHKYAMLIQNYSTLNLTKMTLDGTNLDYSDKASYTLSNNCGAVSIKGKTTIIANDREGVAGDYAFDVYKDKNYAEPILTVYKDVEFNVIGNYDVAAIIPQRNGNVKYYASIEKAAADSPKGTTITALKTTILYDGVVDLNGCIIKADKAINGAPIFRVLGDVTITNGTVNGTTGINSYAFIVGNDKTAGKLTIADGTYKGITSVISITNGEAYISGGTFMTGHDGEGTDWGAQYLLNCMDKAYNAGTAKYYVTGGTFHGFNPANNAAEGKNTNFCATGFTGWAQADGSYIVAKAGAAAKIGDKQYDTLAEALAAATKNQTITLIRDVEEPGAVIKKSITINFNGYTWTITDPVGSTGTESNGLQLMKGYSITLKNGKLTVAKESADKFYILIQNYAALTINNMELDGTYLDKWAKDEDQVINGDSYVVSNNCGSCAIKGETVITSNNDGSKAFALDACDQTAYGYTLPVVTIAEGVVIDDVVFSVATAKDINIECAAYVLNYQSKAVVGFYATLEQAVAKATKYYTVVLMSQPEVTTPIPVTNMITVRKNGFEITADAFEIASGARVNFGK